MTYLKSGLHLDVLASFYHSDCCVTPSLSSSIAKVILEETPKHAWMNHPRLNPNFEEIKRAREKKAGDKFDLGSAVHELILGRGGGIEIIDAADYRTTAAKMKRDAARLAGRTPMLAHQYEEAQQISEAAIQALHEIPECAKFLDPNAGREVVVIWKDIGGPLCRAMIDTLAEYEIYDVKTTSWGLSDAATARAIVNYGYDLSAAFYLRGATAYRETSSTPIKFRWIFVETEPPYEVRVIEADATTLAMGDRKAATAIAKWQRCMESNQWPSYERKIGHVEYPAWAETQWLEREITDPDYVRAVLADTVKERAAE